MSGAICKAEAAMAQKTEAPSVREMIRQREKDFKTVLPPGFPPERFMRAALSALVSDPGLGESTPESCLGALLTAAQLGLEPNTPLGQAYLVPVRSEGRVETQFILGYRGMLDLACRGGEVTLIQAHTVYENDDFELSFGLEPKLRHVPAASHRGEPLWFYAVFRTRAGACGFEVMSAGDIRTHAKRYAREPSGALWKTHFEEMAKKTVLKRLLKYAPLKPDYIRGLSSDETVQTRSPEDLPAGASP